MSRSTCVRCARPVDRVRAANGRWANVEPISVTLTNPGGEIIAVEAPGGHYQETLVRVFRRHTCETIVIPAAGSTRLELNAAAVVEIYVEQQLSLRQIAVACDRSYSAVRQALLDAGVELRPIGRRYLANR